MIDFYNFARDSTLKLLDAPTSFLRPCLLGSIKGHVFVRNERRQQALTTHIADYLWHRRMVIGFSLKTVFAEVTNPTLAASTIKTGKKHLLLGAAGDRVRNKVRSAFETPDESNGYFSALFQAAEVPERHRIHDSSTDTCWIATKNYFNFFHFLTESFQVAYGNSYPATIKRVSFVSRDAELAPFISRWVHDLESLMPTNIKVEILHNPSVEPGANVAVPVSAKHMLYQFAGTHWDEINAARPARRSWSGYGPTPHPVYVLSLNSYDDSLAIFRERAIQLARSRVESRWSKKIIVLRSKSGLRQRLMEGEDKLVESLQPFGFEVVYFEELSPLEQIRCVNNARCIIMQHGAGMSNMLFANSRAHVFELGTFQTARARWGDFMPLCHVAGCHYHNIFLDMNWPHEDIDPVFAKDGLLPPVVNSEDIDRITTLIRRQLTERRDGKIVGLEDHAEYYMSRQAYNQTYRLLDQSKPLADSYPEYWEQRAKLDELCGHRGSAANNFYRAFRMGGSLVSRSGFLRLSAWDDVRRKDLAE